MDPIIKLVHAMETMAMVKVNHIYRIIKAVISGTLKILGRNIKLYKIIVFLILSI